MLQEWHDGEIVIERNTWQVETLHQAHDAVWPLALKMRARVCWFGEDET